MILRVIQERNSILKTRRKVQYGYSLNFCNSRKQISKVEEPFSGQIPRAEGIAPRARQRAIRIYCIYLNQRVYLLIAYNTFEAK